jgi:DNA-binding winged helix-turn-helix (wHTH) protein/predicted ATPase
MMVACDKSSGDRPASPGGVLGNFWEVQGKKRMAAGRRFVFGSFRFDVRTGQLWRDRSEVKLTPRAAAVLELLAERAQDVVTKQELFDRAWRGVTVSDDALTSCIKELRAALGDDARRPRSIETRHRRGYRLMLPATLIADPDTSAATVVAIVPERSRLVGRAAEMQELARCFDQARSGRRQVVFVTGEPGIGKSSLADSFVEQLQTGLEVRIAEGQCIDQHGVGEPYLPLLEALTRLAGRPHGSSVKRILSAQAPSWLAQMPSLCTHPERSALEARGQATRERMMRELTLALEEIASDAPLLLKLEDIHWSDVSTVDWIAHIARRSEPARLMLLASFRPGDAAAAKVGIGALVAELALHGLCREIALKPLNLQAIEGYLTARLGHENGGAQSREFAPLVLDRTGGNPLFMTSIVNQLVERGPTLGTILSIPNDVRRFIDRQIDDLNESDRRLLSAASVIGRGFATASLAAALEMSIEQVEIGCARLARQGVFIVKSGSTTWPDGTLAELYFFRHDLYRELLYERLPPTGRALSHARVGDRLEHAWTGRLDAIAAELAEHFERGRELTRAIPHHKRAAAKALRRSANQEAVDHFQRALEALGQLGDEPERTRTEVELRVGIGAAFMASRGFGAPEVLEAYTRAEVLCDRLGERPEIFPAIWGQWAFRHGRGEFDHARRLCAKLLSLAKKSDNAVLRLHAHHAMWPTLFSCGELNEALAHAEAGLALYDATTHQATASSYGNHDASTCARSFGALSLALLGENERARAMIDDALSIGVGLKDPFSLALIHFFASATGQVLGDLQFATRHAEAGMRVSTEHGFALTRAWSTGVAGWCAAQNGAPDRGFALLAEATNVLQKMQSMAYMPYLLGLLADAQIMAGHQPQAMTAVQDAIATAESTGERFYMAELHRLHGELLAHPSIGQPERVEDAFRMAIKIARQQAAHLLERKADQSLRRWVGSA